jgi:hypothetical protein
MKLSLSVSRLDVASSKIKILGFAKIARAMAIRWISEAEDAGSDMEYLCFLVGVPYGYFTTKE